MSELKEIGVEITKETLDNEIKQMPIKRKIQHYFWCIIFKFQGRFLNE